MAERTDYIANPLAWLNRLHCEPPCVKIESPSDNLYKCHNIGKYVQSYAVVFLYINYFFVLRATVWWQARLLSSMRAWTRSPGGSGGSSANRKTSPHPHPRRQSMDLSHGRQMPCNSLSFIKTVLSNRLTVRLNFAQFSSNRLCVRQHVVHFSSVACKVMGLCE